MSEKVRPTRTGGRTFKTEKVVVRFVPETLKAPILLRCGAILIDYILLISIPIIGLLIARYSGEDGTKLFNNYITNSSLLLMILLAVTNFIILPLFNGQSVGKMLTGLRVVQMNGQHPSIGKLFMRHFLGYLITFLTAGLGFLPVIFNKTGRALHDYLTGTMVIYGSKKVSEEIIN